MKPKIEGVVITPLAIRSDQRGWLTELWREDEPLDSRTLPVMAYASLTLPGMSRGPHEHEFQTDVFCFVGPGDMTLYLWDRRKSSPTCGMRIKATVGETNPCRVIIPPGVVHGYKNDTDHPAMVFNAPDQLFAGQNRSCPVDEIRHEEDKNSPYQLN